MPDKVKVFQNTVNNQPTASLAAVVLPVVTTNSTTQAVIKNLQFSISHPNAAYQGIYSYPYKVKLGDYTLANGEGTGAFAGSQIVDTSQAFTVELQPEDQKVDYGTLDFVATMVNGNNMYYTSIPLNSLGGAPTPANLLTAIDPRSANTSRTQNQWGTAISNVYSSVIVTRAGARQIVTVNGSQLRVYSTLGTQVGADIQMPATIYAITADATYIYGKSSSGDSVIYRWLISTLVQQSNLNTSYTTGYSSVNSGFFEHYNGILYLRAGGGNGTVYRIRASDGVSMGDLGTYTAGSENIGGRITVNQSGVPFIVEHQDTNIFIQNLNTNATFNLTPVWPTDPTTTQGRTSVVLANGIVMFNNASYNYACIVNVNPAVPVATRTDTILPLGSGSTTNIHASGNTATSNTFQTAPVNVTRNIRYDMHASGVEIT